jgi:hypothetical protein
MDTVLTEIGTDVAKALAVDLLTAATGQAVAMEYNSTSME